MNIGERIKKLCRANDIKVTNMEKELGIAKGYITHLEKDGSVPSATRLKKIAAYLGVSEEMLLGHEEPTSSGGVLIPLVGRVSAGLPITAVENVLGQEEISKKLAETGEFFALKIRGDSMSPDIHDGDIVVVRKQSCAEDGDIVIAIVNGDDGVCKTFRRTADAVMLISKNPAYEPLVFTSAELDTVPVKIAGRVVELRRAF